MPDQTFTDDEARVIGRYLASKEFREGQRRVAQQALRDAADEFAAWDHGGVLNRVAAAWLRDRADALGEDT